MSMSKYRNLATNVRELISEKDPEGHIVVLSCFYSSLHYLHSLLNLSLIFFPYSIICSFQNAVLLFRRQGWLAYQVLMSNTKFYVK